MIVKTYRNIPISLADDGKFTARISGRETTRSQLRHIEQLIDGAAAPVHALVIRAGQLGWSGYSVQEVVITRPATGGKFRTDTNRLVGGYGEKIVRYDPKLRSDLVAIIQERTLLETQFRQRAAEGFPFTAQDLRGAPVAEQKELTDAE